MFIKTLDDAYMIQTQRASATQQQRRPSKALTDVHKEIMFCL